MARAPATLPREAIPFSKATGGAGDTTEGRFFQRGHQVELQLKEPFCACLNPSCSPQEGRAHQPSPAVSVPALLCSAGQIPVLSLAPLLPGLDLHRQTSKETGESQPGACSRRACFPSAAYLFPERGDKTINLLMIYYQF